MNSSIFRGCIPALMTPCQPDRTPNFPALVKKGQALVAAGMNGVVYCGSMGDWPLLTDEQRQSGVRQLAEAGVPVIVGTGAQNSAQAAAHATATQRMDPWCSKRSRRSPSFAAHIVDDSAGPTALGADRVHTLDR